MKHAIAELWNCQNIQRQGDIDEAKVFEQMLKDVAIAANATVLGSLSYKFDPQGATALVMIGESHLSLHTWPERNYAAVDVFTCGDSMDPIFCVQEIAKRLGSNKVSVLTIYRGDGGFYLEKEDILI